MALTGGWDARCVCRLLPVRRDGLVSSPAPDPFISGGHLLPRFAQDADSDAAKASTYLPAFLP